MNKQKILSGFLGMPEARLSRNRVGDPVVRVTGQQLEQSDLD